MTINITIIVQVFHFVIAYFIITKIILTPGISIIRQEQNNEQVLLNGLKNISAEISKKEHQKTSLINSFSSQFAQSKPSIEKIQIKAVPLIQQNSEFDSKNIQALRKTLFDVLINKVKHVK